MQTTFVPSLKSPMPEFIDPVFVKTSPKHSFLLIEKERFGLVFANTGSINSFLNSVPTLQSRTQDLQIPHLRGLDQGHLQPTPGTSEGREDRTGLDREWKHQVQAGRGDHHQEGLLHLRLRGEDPGIVTMTIFPFKLSVPKSQQTM